MEKEENKSAIMILARKKVLRKVGLLKDMVGDSNRFV
jgi:hypothetical protein